MLLKLDTNFMELIFSFSRYQFKNGQKVALQEIGPRFTLRLKWVQNSTFDTKFGEFEWVLKVNYSFIYFNSSHLILIDFVIVNRDTKWKPQEEDSSFELFILPFLVYNLSLFGH